MPLGILPEVEFEEEVIPFGPSSCALLYSDGLTDARNVGGDLFGQQRLMQWMLQNLDRELSAAELTQDIQSQLKVFQGSVSPTDDQTGLILAGEPSLISKPVSHIPVPILTSVRSALSSG
jgi:sigma-B regulation protein RsbU (phosphoserine phosphatase)